MKTSRTRECDGKQRHPDKVAALATIGALARKYGAKPSRWSAYECRRCGSFHVGHKPKYRGQR